MECLPNKMIDIISSYLTYNEFKNLEEAKVLPKVFYKSTNKEYKIKKMEKEIKRANNLINTILEHQFIKKCSNSECNVIDTIINPTRLHAEEPPDDYNIKVTEKQLLTKCRCADGYYCKGCRPNSFICDYCPADLNRVCSTCVPKIDLECKTHTSISICNRCAQYVFDYPSTHTEGCEGEVCETCGFCDVCKTFSFEL